MRILILHFRASKTIVLIFLLFLSLGISAQRFDFTHYSVSDGLSQSVVKCIFQDSEGYIWIGTQDGLNKFDGKTFTKYRKSPADTNSISGSWIYDISEDKQGYLWIATRKGLNRFDKQSETFTHYLNKPTNRNSLFSNVVTGLSINKKGEIISNTPPYINILNPKTNKITRIHTGFEPETTVADEKKMLLTDSEGITWISSNAGLVAYEPKTHQMSKIMLGDSFSLAEKNVTALLEDRAGNIWIGTQGGLRKFDKSTQTLLRFPDKGAVNSSFIRSIAQDKDGYIWVATNGIGLHRLSSGNSDELVFRYQDSGNSISNDVLLTLFIDRSNLLWIGNLNGIDKLDLKRAKFNLYQKSGNINSVELSDNIIASVYKYDDETLWIGTWGKGLNIYNRKSGKIEYYSNTAKGKYFIRNNFVHVIFRDKDKHIWIGTRDGIDVYNENRQSFVPLNEFYGLKNIPNFRGYRLYSILEDYWGNIWIATQKGLHRINLEQDTHQAYNVEKNMLSDNLVYQIMEDRDHYIWIATIKGLHKYNPSSNSFEYFKHKANSNSLCNDFVVSLCEDIDGKIWIGTESGINRLDKNTRKFELFTEKQGATDYVVYEILEDKNHNLWFASGEGLYMYNIENQSFNGYPAGDGLQGMEFNTACHRAEDGELFFGGINGLNSFYPDSLHDNPFVAPMVITSFEKTNDEGTKIIKLGKKPTVELSYNDYIFTINFAALDYTAADKNHYSYQMSGISEKWIEIGNRRFVSFSNLPAGEYVFSVKGSNSDQFWNPESKSIQINVKPHWARSKWAFAGYITGFLLAIFAFFKIREQRLIHERKILKEKVAERTAQIEKQKKKIEENHQDVTDSINYASRIQAAVLPATTLFEGCFADYFVLFKPRDLVSGDFYWVRKINNYTVAAVADCTGHGVPGAFLSMLGMSLLSEIVSRKDVTQSSEILEILRDKLKKALQQTQNSEQKDGMDIALFVINNETSRLQFSGANNPIYIIREKKLIVFKGDKQPIGIHPRERAFINHEIRLQKNDLIYLFSDGYRDQFNGKTGEKFKTRRFVELLLSMSEKTLSEQKQVLESTFNSWKGSSKQIDDVLVLGVKY